MKKCQKLHSIDNLFSIFSLNCYALLYTYFNAGFLHENPLQVHCVYHCTQKREHAWEHIHNWGQDVCFHTLQSIECHIL